MLKVNFRVEFDEKGELIVFSRDCKIPTPNCNECMYEKWCDRIEKRILSEEKK